LNWLCACDCPLGGFRSCGPPSGQVADCSTPRLATDDLATLRTTAGIGIALLPDSLIRKGPAEGSLVEALPQAKVVRGVVHLVFVSRRGLVPAVRALSMRWRLDSRGATSSVRVVLRRLRRPGVSRGRRKAVSLL
jgi:hypothetical protein